MSKDKESKNEIAIDFYNVFSYEISCIKTIKQKNAVLSRMEETFREAVGNKPDCRNELSKIYQELKIQCEKANGER